MCPAREPAAQFVEVIDLAVKDNADSLILVLNWLVPARKIDNAQAAHPQADWSARINAVVVRPAVNDALAHPVDIGSVDYFVTPPHHADLFIRRKGKDAYVEALRHSQRYFDYLIERARTQFPVRTPEGKVKAINHLLPHIQRVPSRIVRDELAHEIALRLAP